MFVGREKDLELMTGYLAPSTTSTRRRSCVIYGLGGMGKTQLAIEYSRRHNDSYTSTFWLDGRTEESLLHSILSLASRLPREQIPDFEPEETKGIEETKRSAMALLKWFSLEGNDNWLLIYDNIDETSYGAGDDDTRSLASYNIQDYLPPGDRGAIIITTRLERLVDLGLDTSIKLRILSTEEGLSLLRKTSCKTLERSIELTNDDADMEIAKYNPGQFAIGSYLTVPLMSALSRAFAALLLSSPSTCSRYLLTTAADAVALVERLEGLPLALVFAGSYIRSISVKKYMELYNTSWKSLHERMRGRPDYTGTILTTWSISYSAVIQRNEDAAKLLQLWGYLDSQDVWYELLKWQFRQGSAPEWLKRITVTESAFIETIQTLIEFSLVEEKESSNSYSMHSVVHDWIKWHINQSKKDEMFRTSIICVGVALPMFNSAEFWTRMRRILPHLILTSRYYIDENDFMDYHDWQHRYVLQIIGHMLREQRRYKEAGEFYSRLLHRAQDSLGSGHEYVLTILDDMGSLHMNQGKLAEAGAVYEQALKKCQDVLGLDHSKTLSVSLGLSKVYIAQDRLDDCAIFLTEALKEYQKGPDGGCKADLSLAFTNLGGLYVKQGKLAEAETQYELAVRGWQEEHGAESRLALTAASNLGIMYLQIGDMARGTEIVRRTLERQERIFGREDPNTLRTASVLGLAYEEQGRLLEAKSKLEWVVAGYGELFEANDPGKLQALTLLKRVEQKLRDQEAVGQQQDEISNDGTPL